MKNKSIDLFGSNWKILFKDSIVDENDNWIYGRVLSDRRTIEISLKDSEGDPLPKEEIELTVYHELIHAVFISGQYLRSSDDEPLVEWTARCLFALKKQKII